MISDQNKHTHKHTKREVNMSTIKQALIAKDEALELMKVYNIIQLSLRDEVDDLEEYWEDKGIFVSEVFVYERYKDKLYNLKREINKLEIKSEIETLKERKCYKKLSAIDSQIKILRKEEEALWEKEDNIKDKLYKKEMSAYDMLIKKLKIVEEYSIPMFEEIEELYV